jgi:hydroxyacylglutathione hydrolase
MAAEQSIFPVSINTIQLSINKFLNYPVNSNCYVISTNKSDQCIIVDPAQQSESSLDAYLLSQNLIPIYIILTHEHFDHILSIQDLKNKYASLVIASSACSENITDPKQNLSFFLDQKGFVCPPADIIIDETNSQFEWLGLILKFYLTPGHSNGGLCFNIGENLFTGDTIMRKYKPVFKLPGGDKLELEKSINKLKQIFNKDILVFPGHGNIFRLGELNS